MNDVAVPSDASSVSPPLDTPRYTRYPLADPPLAGGCVQVRLTLPTAGTAAVSTGAAGAFVGWVVLRSTTRPLL